MFQDTLLADLAVELPSAVRLQRLVVTLREYFRCGAVCLLQLKGEALTPVAVDGLVHEALGRRFVIAQHPRLAAILASRRTVSFPPDSTLPDPYDGLIEQHPGEPLHVHDCMGISLHEAGETWGVLTLDALCPGVFDRQAEDDLQRFTLLVEAAVRMTRLEQDIRGLRLVRHDSETPRRRHDDGEILGQSMLIRRLLEELDVVADSELPVLLSGETGVGKELFARRLHQQSPRAAAPLVHVNCAALPESLAESELFGHVKGAFSGADTARPGRFEAAHGGTLFLDEIGELPLAIQAKLLRALQNGEIQRLGEDTPRRVDVRIIAATNRHLQDGVRDGHFRADLYHRLSVYPVPIPPLRKRGSDVLVLAGHFLELNRARLGLRSLRLSAQAEATLCAYEWPGNVRELEHVISRAAIKALSRGAARHEIITLEAELLDLAQAPLLNDASSQGLSQRLSQERSQEPTQERSGQDNAAPEQHRMSLQESVTQAQRQAIALALEANRGNWAAAARHLNVDPSNLHKLARRLGVKGAV
ncbi:nitric oxide reductase transcriptional regulator NorR [Vreelandella rituensis]|uniref:Nitric oxide reductase transcriptional regulator NorR n=1 Tax=Vreelandella rituensis TaxID=2282306 RepID=A0A368TS43_9GAMM|nr:nitric oxide reductase transcriptional regulator NorR [Halomonas rituensis]RCV87569.1 nitric oxide reductase transcriptional regulator NorR [Halomonas rituensis]